MVGIDISILLLVAIAVGGGIISTVVIGLLVFILIQLKKEPQPEEDEVVTFPGIGYPGGVRINLADMQRAAAMTSAQTAAEAEEKTSSNKPEASGGTYI